MTAQLTQNINFFDRFSLNISPSLKYHNCEDVANRVLFISDKNETFIVSFEEGMQTMDMIFEGKSSISFQYREGGKYIHQCRIENGYAFFHIELIEKDGNTVYLPGQMTVEQGYKWADGIEPILMELMYGIEIL